MNSVMGAMLLRETAVMFLEACASRRVALTLP